jgi:hypothetical protein
MKTWSKQVLAGVLSLVGVSMAGTASAQTAEKKPAGGGEADMMKPPAELQQYKSMIGTWKCDGQLTMQGKATKTTGTYKAAWDLDNHFVVAHFEGKAAGMPGSHKGTDIYGYDTTNKTYVQYGFDSFGMISKSTSKGWEGDKQEWTGTASAMGQEMPMKTTVTKKGDKEITLSGGMGGDAWEATCKK